MAGKSPALRRRAFCQINVNGQDVTNRFDPYLISVTVTDVSQGTDTCAIELSDRDARLAIPKDGAPITILLGWQNESLALVFQGIVANVESGFGRKQGGRRLWVEGTGTDLKGPIKTPSNLSMGEGQKDDSQDAGSGANIALPAFLSKAGQKAGFNVMLGPSMQGVTRDFFQQNESFMHLMTRMASELGGVAKFSGNTAILVDALNGETATGETMPTVDAEWGVNLLGWRIKPFVGRPQIKAANSSFFKPWDAVWDGVQKSVGGSTPFGNAGGEAQMAFSAPNKQVGEQHNTGQGNDSQGNRGTGWALMIGEPQAKALGKLGIIGARPGVDGTYYIKEAEHTYTRGGGYVTRCNVVPQDISGGYKNFNEWESQETPT